MSIEDKMQLVREANKVSSAIILAKLSLQMGYGFNDEKLFTDGLANLDSAIQELNKLFKKF